jgi:hypothetical protein
MKRTIIGVVAAVLLAAIGTVILITFVRGAEERALAGQETVEVLVISEDVARGTAVEELEASVVSERIPAKVRPNGTVVSLDDLEGKVASVDLVAGEQRHGAVGTSRSDGQAIGVGVLRECQVASGIVRERHDRIHGTGLFRIGEGHRRKVAVRLDLG